VPVFLARFANPAVICEGWYAVGAARRIGVGDRRRIWIGARDLILYRDREGALRAVDRACPHMGADLAQATVVGQGLQCGFHQWRWGPDGSCTAGGGVGSGARLRTYAVRERWGLTWIWAGDTPTYELPEPEAVNTHVVHLPSQTIKAHAHLVLGNGLDIPHLAPLHALRVESPPVVAADDADRVGMDVHLRIGATAMRRALGLAGRTARWRFTAIGASLAWVTVTEPVRFELLLTARPLPDGGCATKSLFFLPRWITLARALPMMATVTWADRVVLEGLDFRPGFVASDAVFERYALMVDALPEWRSR
jgi:phenylpropionate dioxygenase-like ring-hydroxylating dioxygenase large terminal subunit